MFNTVEGRILLTAENDTRKVLDEVSDNLGDVKKNAGEAGKEGNSALGGIGVAAGKAAIGLGIVVTAMKAVAESAGFVGDAIGEFEKHSITINTMAQDLE